MENVKKALVCDWLDVYSGAESMILENDIEQRLVHGIEKLGGLCIKVGHTVVVGRHGSCKRHKSRQEHHQESFVHIE